MDMCGCFTSIDKYLCIHRYEDKSKITGYRLKNRNTGEIIDLTPQELKQNYTKYNPINLKLTSDNKIMYTPYKEVANLNQLIQYNDIIMKANITKVMESLNKKTSEMTNYELEVIYSILADTIDLICALQGDIMVSIIKDYNLDEFFNNKKLLKAFEFISDITFRGFAEKREFHAYTGYNSYKFILDEEHDQYYEDVLVEKIAEQAHKLENRNLSLAAILARISLECLNNKQAFFIKFIDSINNLIIEFFKEYDDDKEWLSSMINTHRDQFRIYEKNGLIKLGCLHTKTILKLINYIYSDCNRRENEFDPELNGGVLALPLFPYTSEDIEAILNKKKK